MRVRDPVVAIALLTCFSLSPFAALAQDADAPEASMFLYDAAHTGIAPKPLAMPISLNWKYTSDQVGEHIVSSPAADADTVCFFVGRSMYALSRTTGAAKWEKPLEIPNNVDSTPVVKDGVAVFGCRDGRVYFVDVGAANGKITGNFDLRRQHPGFTSSSTTTQPRVQSSPLYHDGMIFFGGDDGWLYALDLASQEKVWEFRTKAPIKASPSYWNHGVYVASTDGSLYGLSEKTGRRRWQTKLWRDETDPKDVLASPVVANSKVFAARGKYLYACDHGRHGYVRWRFEAKGNIVGTPAVSGEYVLFGDSEGKFYTLRSSAEGDFSYSDIDSEYIVWQVPPESTGEDAPADEQAVVVDGLSQPVKSSPTIVDDAVLYRAGPRQVNALRIEDGALVWHCNLSEAAAAATQGTPSMTATGVSVAGLGGFDLGGMGGMGAPGGAATLGGLSTTAGLTTATPALVFEDELCSSPVAAGDDLYVVGDDGALYAFSQRAADGVPPEFDQAGIEVPGRGESRHAQDLKIHKSSDEAAGEEDKPKLRGALPVYVRLKVFDDGSGIDPQSLTVTQDSGGERVRWEAAYDAAGSYLWAICEPGKGGVSRNLPDGDYVLTFAGSDWAGNQGNTSVAFVIDNSLAPPGPAPTPRLQPGAPGMGMPGMGEPGMMMPGGAMPGMPGGGMPGMPGGGMPGMPALPGMP